MPNFDDIWDAPATSISTPDPFDAAWESASPVPQGNAVTSRLFQDPIGALTSADWWLTRPSGEKLSVSQAIAGPAVKALDALTLGAGDEISALGASALSDKTYEEALAQARGAQGSFEQASPVASTALSLAGALKTPLFGAGIFSAKTGVLPALSNIAKGGAIGSGIGATSGFLSGEGENRLTSALSGAKWGAGLGVAGQTASEGLQGIAGHLAQKAKSTEESLVGYTPELKQKIAGFADEAGAAVNKPVEGGAQVGSLDEKVADLRDAGFFGKIKASDSPAKVANKLSLFKNEVGANLGTALDDAAKAEANMLGIIHPQQKAFYFKQAGAPDFKGAVDYVTSIAEVDPTVGATLAKKLGSVVRAWEKSDKSIASLNRIRKNFGLINKQSFSPNLSDADRIARGLNNKIYGSLAEAMTTRVEGLGKWVKAPELITKYKAANKAFSAASEFENRAFNASKKFGLKQAAKDLWSLKTVPAAIGYAAAGPIGALALGAERISKVASDIAPVQTSKLANIASKGVKGVSKAIPSPAVIGNIAGQKSGEKEPAALQKAMTIAQTKAPSALAGKPKKVDLTSLDSVDENHPLVAAVVKQESNGNPKAIGKPTKYGRAKGLMQLLDTTAKAEMKEMGLDPKDWDPFNAKLNKKVGTRYLNKMIKKYDGNVIKALMAYNWGEGNLRKYERGIYKSIPKETKQYVNKILGEKVFL